MTEQVVFGVAAPVVIAAVFFIPWLRAQRGAHDRDRIAFRVPLGLGAAVVIAFVALYGWPPPDREFWRRVMYIALAGTAVGIGMALTPRTVWVRAAEIVVLGILTTILIWPVIRADDPVLYRIIPGAGTVVLAAGLEPLVVRRSGPSITFALAVVVGTVAATILLGLNFLKLSIPIGALSIALLVGAGCALFEKRFSLADGAIAVIAPVIVSSLVVAHLYLIGDAASIAILILPFLAAPALWIAEIKPLSRSRWMGSVARIAIAMVLCGAALLLMQTSSGDDADDPYAELYGE